MGDAQIFNPMLLVAGSLSLDTSYRCDCLPQLGETVYGAAHIGVGGRGANQAVAAARAGAEVRFYTAVGDDPQAFQAGRLLDKEPMQGRLISKQDAPTGTAATYVDAQGKHQTVRALGANALLTVDDIPEVWLTESRLCLAQLESNRRTTARLLDHVGNHGITTILNVSPMHPEDAVSCVHKADILVASVGEFSTLIRELHPSGYGDFTENQLHALSDAKLHALCRELVDKAIVLTLGARGCFISLAQGHKLIPALRLEPVVDTTATADAFVGALAAGHLHFQGDLVQAAQFASAAQALCATRYGAAESMPTLQEIEAILG